MEAFKLQNVIDTLSRIVNVPDEKKQELITKYSTMSEQDVIKELSQIIYRVLRDKEELYN